MTIHTVTGTDSLTYIYDDVTKHLQISGSGLNSAMNYGVISVSPSGTLNVNDMKTCYINEGVTQLVTNSFNGCRSLIKIDIPQSVTYLGSQVFQACSVLTELKLPGVTSIGYDITYACSALNRMYIYYNGLITLRNTITIPSTISHIYVQPSQVSTYKTATNWSNYADKISALPYQKMTKGWDKIQVESAVRDSAGRNIATKYVRSVNGNTPSAGNVTISIPTKTSDLTNDSNFITSSDIPNITVTDSGSGAKITAISPNGHALSVSHANLVENDIPSLSSSKINGLATVATSGSYDDLSDKPTIPEQVQSDWNETSTASKAYIQNKPTIPEQVQSNWNETDTTSKAYIQNKPSISVTETWQITGDGTTTTFSHTFNNILRSATMTAQNGHVIHTAMSIIGSSVTVVFKHAVPSGTIYRVYAVGA